MKISKGMYARVKELNDTAIVKVVEIDQFDNDGFKADNNMYYLFSDIIGKPSFDLIDLIEVGDYVNGEKVTETMIKMRDEQGVFGLPDHYRTFVDEIHIKSVVTKEQFNSCKYVVERDK